MLSTITEFVTRSYKKIFLHAKQKHKNAEEFVYVANQGENNISQYKIAANNSLEPLQIATVAAGTTPVFIAIHPLGKYAYVANQGSNNISQFEIGDNGSLQPLAVPVVAAVFPSFNRSLPFCFFSCFFNDLAS